MQWRSREGGIKDDHNVSGFSTCVDDGVTLRGGGSRILLEISVKYLSEDE